MPQDDIRELNEQAQQLNENPWMMPISFTVSVLAVLVAIITLLGHRAHTEELLLQSRATDTWAEYQAKNIRRHNYDMLSEMMSVSDFKDAARADKVKQHFRQQIERYDKEKDDTQREAKKLEAEVRLEQGKANRYDLGEAFLEMGLVITSIALLTRRRGYWFAGMLIAALGLASALSAYWVH